MQNDILIWRVARSETKKIQSGLGFAKLDM